MLSRADNDMLVQTSAGTPMGELLRRFWIPALLSSEIAEPDCPPVRVRLLSEDLIAFRDSQGRVGLLDRYCPHRRASLFWGRNEECGLRCVYHGWKFDVDGNCVDLPNAVGGDVFKENMKTTSYPTVERSGLIWAYMGPKAEMPPPPATELFDLPESHRYIAKIHTSCNWVQALEGDIDSSHVGFLHRKFEGAVLPSDHLNSAVFEDLAPRYFVRQADYGLQLAARREANEREYSWRITQWLMPFSTLVAAPDKRPAITNLRVPVDDMSSIHFRIYARYDQPLTDEDRERIAEGEIFPEMVPGTFETVANRGNDYLIDRQAQKDTSYTGIYSVPVQDYAVASDQGGGAIADRTKEHLTTSDAAISMMRKRVLDAAKKLTQGVRPPEASNPGAYRVRSIDINLPRDVDFENGTRHLTYRAA